MFMSHSRNVTREGACVDKPLCETLLLVALMILRFFFLFFLGEVSDGDGVLAEKLLIMSC